MQRLTFVMRASSTLATVIALGAALSAKPCRQPTWTVDLVSTYHLSSFRTGKHPTFWQRQRGILFTSPDTLVVYHVVETMPTTLERRKVDGGGGRFILRAIFLDKRNGNELRRLQWTTTAHDQSEIYATHDGRFLVRTGGSLHVYSREFREIATKALPTNPANLHDYWFTTLVPPGKLLFVEHHWYNGPDGPAGKERSLVDSDTLRTIRNPSPADVSFWPQARYLLPELVKPKSQPQTPTSLDQIDELVRKVLENGKRGNCTISGFVGIRQQTYEPSCRKLNLLSTDGNSWWQLNFRNEIGALGIDGNTLAVTLERWPSDPLDIGLPPRPVRLNVYDVAKRSERCSIDLRKVSSYQDYDFAVSSDGTLAVRLRDKVRVF